MNWTLQNADGQQISYAAGAVPTVYAPTNAPYVTVTPDANLSAEFALSTLSSGILYNNSGSNPSIATALQVPQVPYILLAEQLSNGIAAGTFTTGAWRTRSLNTEMVDTDNICSLLASVFTIPAGTYDIVASAPGYNCGLHVIRLYNVTDGAVQVNAQSVTVAGSGMTSGTGMLTVSEIIDRFTINASKQMRLEHSCSATKTTDGLGIAANQGVVETYSRVQLWKVA